MADDLVQALATTLLTCLCDAVASQENPPTECCFRVGSEAVADMDSFQDLCCEGFAYVIMGDQWVSINSFPEMDIVRQANARCGIGAWGIEFKIGIFRCIPTGTSTSMPTCEDWTAAAIQNITDARSLRLAACCFKDTALDMPVMDGMSVVINRQIQGPVQGGCSERSLRIQIQVPACDPC